MEPVERLCDFLRGASGYAVLRNPDVVSNLVRGGDVDLLVQNIHSFSKNLLKSAGSPLMYMNRSYVHGFFWAWGHVDLLPTIEWHGAVFVDTKKILEKALLNSFGLSEASLPYQAVISWFASLLWGGFFKMRYRDVIVQAAREHERELFQILEHAVGSLWARRLLEAAQAGRPEDSVNWVGALRRVLWWRAFRRAPLATVKGWVRFWFREIMLRIEPPVLWIAVLGPDGSGKSTLLQALKQRLGRGRPFLEVRIFHWRPGRIGGGKASGPVTDPHGEPPRGFLASCAKVGLLAIDWVLGYWLDLAHLRAKGILVAFDRHYVDLLVDPKRYRYGGPMKFAEFIGHWIPRPDLFIILDLPAEVAHARKPEVPLEEARRLRERYLKLGASLPKAYVVDASRPLEEVEADVVDLILRHMASRTAQRIRGLGLC